MGEHGLGTAVFSDTSGQGKCTHATQSLLVLTTFCTTAVSRGPDPRKEFFLYPTPPSSFPFVLEKGTPTRVPV